jgi:TatA/E family protein of Tat protein translocase
MITAEIFSPEIIIVIILAVVLLFAGPRLPKFARSIGEANKEFKKAQREAAEEAKAEPVPPTEDKITMSKSELDALIAEREAKARRDAEKPPAN